MSENYLSKDFLSEDLNSAKKNIYSVTQVNSYIKNMFLRDRALTRISVKGEVSNCKYHSSGHIYFTLKDSGGALSAIMFASRRVGLPFTMQNGQQVIVTGSIEVYEKGGTYQIYADRIEQAGIGDLYERFLRLKEKLEDMGMFAPEYKQKIPEFCRTIGIATASTGAAVQDIINVTRRRNPFVQLVFVPTKVQGRGAAESIVRSIRALDDYGVDVIIVGRGGGSIEDLWAFNEEIVARAIFDCRTPIISAVGHETDFTIADFAADMRAPTPSAAAEIATMDMMEFLRGLKLRADRLKRAENGLIIAARNKAEMCTLRLNRVSPSYRINSYKAMSEEYRMRLARILEDSIVEKRHELALRAEKLKGLSPLDKISKGYAWVSDSADKHVTKAAELKPGQNITIRFADGRATANVTEVSHE